MTKEDFLKGVENWSNHRLALFPALEATEGDVVEMGMGHGSSPFLKAYCDATGRALYSYENNPDWFEKCWTFNPARAKLIHDWDEVAENHITPGVVLIDHAPGERRKIDIERFALRARVIVIHDSEPAADHGYQMRQHFKLFKYTKDYTSSGAWASALSNFVDVTKFCD